MAHPAQAYNALIKESVVTGRDNSAQNSNRSNIQYTEYRDRYYDDYSGRKKVDGANTGIVQQRDRIEYIMAKQRSSFSQTI